MTKTAETGLWTALRDALKTFRAAVHYTRIENSVSDGFPDVELQMMVGNQSFHSVIELKTAARPVRPESPVPVELRPAQIPWLRKRWNAGGSAWLLVQVGSGAKLRRYLLPGILAKDVEAGQPEAWFVANSVCDGKARLETIAKLACTFRALA